MRVFSSSLCAREVWNPSTRVAFTRIYRFLILEGQLPSYSPRRSSSPPCPRASKFSNSHLCLARERETWLQGVEVLVSFRKPWLFVFDVREKSFDSIVCRTIFFSFFFVVLDNLKIILGNIAISNHVLYSYALLFKCLLFKTDNKMNLEEIKIWKELLIIGEKFE